VSRIYRAAGARGVPRRRTTPSRSVEIRTGVWVSLGGLFSCHLTASELQTSQGPRGGSRDAERHRDLVVPPIPSLPEAPDGVERWFVRGVCALRRTR
jgi:hypothetical protein